MKCTVRTLVRGDLSLFELDRDGSALQPVKRDVANTGLLKSPGYLGDAGELAFALVGEGPSFDLSVSSAEGSVTLTGADITKNVFCHHPDMDAIWVVDGDPGTSISRGIVMIPLAPLRAAVSAGGSLAFDHLDSRRLVAGPAAIDLDFPGFGIFPLRRENEVGVFWNTPQANPAEAWFVSVSYPYYQVGADARTTVVQNGRPVRFDRFWVVAMTGGRVDNGNLLVSALGVSRPRRDFQVGLRRLIAEGEAMTLGRALVECAFTEQQTDVRIRHNASLEPAIALDSGSEYLAVVEMPDRSKTTVHIEMGLGQPIVTELACDGNPSKIWVVADQEHPNSADSDLPADSLGADTLAVGPAGAAVSLGQHDAASLVTTQVYVVGDGAQAGLETWLAHARGPGKVEFTLHLRADREIRVRYAVVHPS